MCARVFSIRSFFRLENALKIVEARRSVVVEPQRPSPGRRRRVDVGSPRPSGRARREPEGVDVASLEK